MVVNGDLNVRSVSSLEGRLFRVESTGIRNLRGSLVVSSGPRVSKHVADDVQQGLTQAHSSKSRKAAWLVQLDLGQQPACIELQRVVYRSMWSVSMLISSFKVFVWAIIDLCWGEGVGIP